MPRNKLTIHHIPINDLRPAKYNPRRWDEQATSQLKQSLKKFGFVDPIIANGAIKRHNVIIGGHFRWAVAKELGIKKVPVVYVNIPNLAKEKELNLRLNRNTGEFNLELLKKFDVELLLDVGFDDSDLENIWNDVLETEDDNYDSQEKLTQIKTAKTKPGDIYTLGQHRLICGDATDIKVVKKLARARSVNMIYCDPPYNIKLDYQSGISTKGKYGVSPTKDNMPDEHYRNFLKNSLLNALSVSRKDCHVFYWCDEKYIGMLQDLYREHNVNPLRVCLWIKNNFNMTPQVAFNKVYEPCVYGTIGRPYLAKKSTSLNEVMNKEVGTGNRALDDILDLIDIWLVKRKSAKDYTHPTEKPPTLHEKAIRRCTKPGDTILDLFGGSGSTLVACEQMKRKCLIYEKEPIFCDLIIDRFQSLTSLKAKKL
jgi:DNA modification methylase